MSANANIKIEKVKNFDELLEKNRDLMNVMQFKSGIELNLGPPYLRPFLLADKKILREANKEIQNAQFNIYPYAYNKDIESHFFIVQSSSKSLISLIAELLDDYSQARKTLFKDIYNFTFSKLNMSLDDKSIIIKIHNEDNSNGKLTHLSNYGRARELLKKIIARSIIEIDRIIHYANGDAFIFLINKIKAVAENTESFYIKKAVKTKYIIPKVNIEGKSNITKYIKVDFDEKNNEYMLSASILYTFEPFVDKIVNMLSLRIKNKKLRATFKEDVDSIIKRTQNPNSYFDPFMCDLSKPYASELKKYFTMEYRGTFIIFHFKFPLYAVGHKEENRQMIKKIDSMFDGKKITNTLKKNSEALLDKTVKIILEIFKDIHEKDNCVENEKNKNDNLQLF